MSESSMAFGLRPVVVGWLLTVGVDLFFNAGLFSGLFNQSREPGLLPDQVLFRRIPVAYVALAVAVTALAWLFDRIDVRGAFEGAALGGLTGFVVAFMGVINLWTAVEMTGIFVASAALVQVIELSAVGAFLGSYRGSAEPKRLVQIALATSLFLAIMGIIIQNLLK